MFFLAGLCSYKYTDKFKTGAQTAVQKQISYGTILTGVLISLLLFPFIDLSFS